MGIELLKFRNKMALVWCFVLVVQAAFSQNLATWELSSATGSQTNNTPSILTNGINDALLNRGAGVTAIGWPGSMNSSGWFSSTSPTTLSEAITNNDYYQFTLTVADGYKAKVTGIELVLRSSNTGPNKVTLRSSVDNFAADLGTATVTTAALLETMSFTNALTNLTGTVTFRLYGYGSAANTGSSPGNTGTLRIGAGSVATDNDLVILGSVAPMVNLSASSSLGSEANKTSITLTATTTSNVAGDQTVEVSVTGNGITSGDYSLSATKITILNGTKTGSITLTIVDDFEAEATETATITLVNPSSGLELGTTLVQTVEITDNDAKGVILVESENTTKVTEGGANDSYTIVLNSQPTANVSIGITTGVQLTATPAALTFTTANWNIPQTVTISAVDDATVEGNHSTTISHTVSSADAMYNGLTVASVSVTITDNDQAFNCPTLTTQNSTSFETCNDNSTNDITVETTRNDLSVKLVYFSSAKTGAEMYTGGTVIGNATAPSGASAPFLINFNDLIFPVNQTGNDVTYYVYAILDLEDAELTEASCRPSLQFVITIKPQRVPSVALSSSDADNTIEAGTSVTFTATPTNGGVSPSYRWKKNNVTVGDKSATYTDDNLVNGDQITVDLLSSTVCAVPATVTSAPLAMTVTYPSTMCVKLANECVELGGTYSKGGEYNQRPTYSDGKGHTIFQKDDSWWLVNGVAGAQENVLFKKQYALGSIPAVPPTAGWSSDICKNATFSISFEACVCVSPTAYAVTGGGSYCAGGDGVVIGLSSSEVGVTYQLKNGTSAVGSPVSGTGSALTFGAQKATGTYTVEATRTTGGCTATMTESVKVTTDAASVGGKVTLMTGTALICKGATGSTSYELSGQIGSVLRWESSSSSSFEQGKTIANTSTSLQVNLGEVTETTYYRAVVQNGLCNVAYSDVVSIAVESIPTKFNVTGGGSYCAGGEGILIGLSNSEVGVTYQLKNGTSAVGSSVSGTGSALTFGAQKATGTYTVEATRTTGGCTATMTESVKVTTEAASVGGKVTLTTGTALICKGATGSTSYELSGQIGSLVRWESSSSSSFEQGKTIANTSTSLEVNLGEVTETTYYRAVVQNGLCNVAYSDVVSIAVESLPTRFKVTGGGSICTGSTGAVLLSGSEVGAVYSLMRGANEQVGDVVAGTGASLSFGGIAKAGTYTIKATKGICVVAMEGEAVISLQAKPTISLTTLQQTLNEGAIQQLCDTDANPVNTLQWAVTTGCGSGNPSWRVQAGSNAWSDWSTNPPVSQLSNNQVYRYQAACDTQCPTTYTNPIEVTIRYRASVPQNVSLVIEGVKVTPGETKEICTSGAHSILVTASCGADEQLLYSVDGGEYLGLIPTGLVDNQYHNYRVRCRKTDGTVSCVESESGTMRLKLVDVPAAPNVSITPTTSCDLTAHFSGQSTCGNLKTVWYNAATNVALPMLPTQVPTATVSYYARCQTESGSLSEKSNTVTFTLQPTQQAPVVTVSEEMVCIGKVVKVSSNCPAGSTTFWNTGVTTPSFEVAFNNVTKQTYWAKCVFEGGCQSIESVRKDVYWNAFVVTTINLGESKSAIKTNNRSAWASQFVTRDGGPELEQSTQANPTLYFVENGNKVAPRYWTMNVDACALGTAGSVTFDVLTTPEVGVIKSFNTHENNAPYFMYANRDGWTELYGPNHPAYGFYEADGNGGNVYDAGLPKGLYKLSVRYWDMKGWGSSYPATRKPQGNVLAYQEYWFRIQSKDGVGVGAAREGATTLSSRRDLSPNSFATILPNPVTNILHLQVQDSKGQVVQSTLTDASGREVSRRQFVAETNTHQEEFGVRELPTGVYFLKVSTSGEQTTLKVVKVP